jgi:uracil-DNA glycosylase family 4
MEKIEEISKIKSEIESCKKCGLHKTRKNPVVGEGSLDVRVMFIGEAPGFNEDLQGKPFVGKAGKVFDELLKSIGIDRKDVYITNILKCKPPENRSPKPEEIKSCTPYLDSQIAIIKPMIIVTLGSFSMSYIFNKFGLEQGKISNLHGRDFKITNLAGIEKVIPLYHPAVATYNPGMKSILLNDFKSIGGKKE